MVYLEEDDTVLLAQPISLSDKVHLKWLCHATRVQYTLNEYVMLPEFNTTRISIHVPCHQCSIHLEWVCHAIRVQYWVCKTTYNTQLPRFSTTWMCWSCCQASVQLKLIYHVIKVHCILNEKVVLPGFNTTWISVPCCQGSVQLEWVCHVTNVQYNLNE